MADGCLKLLLLVTGLVLVGSNVRCSSSPVENISVRENITDAEPTVDGIVHESAAKEITKRSDADLLIQSDYGRANAAQPFNLLSMINSSNPLTQSNGNSNSNNNNNNVPSSGPATLTQLLPSNSATTNSQVSPTLIFGGFSIMIVPLNGQNMGNLLQTGQQLSQIPGFNNNNNNNNYNPLSAGLNSFPTAGSNAFNSATTNLPIAG